MSARMDRLLRPASIAVIGGGFWCTNVVAQCRKMGFKGPIWPVHPSRDEVSGEKAFRSIGDLPGAPDAVFVGVNRDATIGVLAELSARGAGGAVAFAAGFAEAEAETGDGRALQSALVEAAGEMPVLGPNCYGFINYLDGVLLWPDQQGGKRVDQGVAIVTQSSNIAINMTMAARGLPLAYVVTAGNQAQTGMAEIGTGLLDDPRVTALGLHIEGVGDLAAFEALARRASFMGKPVIVLKVGKSAAAQVATVSHTASLAGSEAGANALFRRLGMARASSISAFLECLKLAHIVGPLPSNRIASMSCSGGEASLMADMAEPLGLVFPALDAAQTSGLRDALGPKVSLANPLDYNTYIWPDTNRMAATFTAMMQGDLALGIVVLDFPRGDRCSDADWAHVVEAVAHTAEASGKRMAILASLPETLPEHWSEEIAARGIVPLSGMAEGLEAVALCAGFGVPDPVPLMIPYSNGPADTLSEAASKSLLAAHGVPLPGAAQARSPDGAAREAAALGFPVVLKGEGFAHKTEAGAVVLGLSNEVSVREAAARMGCDTFLVEQMVTGTLAELLVGITVDAAHGYVLTLGAGGQLTEVMKDTAHLLVPARAEEIRAAIMSLNIAPILKGYRGQPGADINAIVDVVLAVQDCVVQAGGAIVEAEVNPLLALPDGAIAVDALIRKEIR